MIYKRYALEYEFYDGEIKKNQKGGSTIPTHIKDDDKAIEEATIHYNNIKGKISRFSGDSKLISAVLVYKESDFNSKPAKELSRRVVKVFD